MPISIACSKCQKKLKVPDAAAGKKVRCPACQGVVAVPAAEAESSSAEEAVTSAPAPKPSSVPTKSKSKPAAWDKDDKADDDEDKDKFEDDSRPSKKKKKASEDTIGLSEDEDEDEDDRPRKRKKRKRDTYEDDYGDLRRRRVSSPHRGTTILTLGILTIFLACVCPLICWILGGRTINMANEDISRMDSGTMDRSGRGNTTIGKTCAIIGVVLGIINAIAGIILRVSEIGNR